MIVSWYMIVTLQPTSYYCAKTNQNQLTQLYVFMYLQLLLN